MRKLWYSLLGMYYYRKKFGKGGGKLFRKLNSSLTNELFVPGIKHSISLRPNTTDIPTFKQLFYESEYEFSLDFKPRTIIDGGANIGLAAVYFSNKYPNARIYSVEPEPSNFEMVKLNTKNYPNVSAFNSALSANDGGFIEIQDVGLGNWGFMTKEVSQENLEKSSSLIPTISISKIMADYGITVLDLVKIDIEGAEKELFENGYEKWLPKTRVLVVELHDRMKPGCSKSVFSAICQYDFSFSHKGENLIFTNNAHFS